MSYHIAIRAFAFVAAETITHCSDTWLLQNCRTHIHTNSRTHTGLPKYLTTTKTQLKCGYLHIQHNSIW